MDEMFFHFSSGSDPQNTIPQDEILDYVPMGGSNSRGRQRKLLSTEKRENSNADDKKKSMHRDIERQRRQEMSTLYASLRTLLPLEYIKGKRAISDHMNGAVSYVKDLQKRIDGLNAKRDELKKASDNWSGFEQGMTSNEAFPSSAVVRQSLDGVEVVISTSVGPKALTLSRVLQLLLEEGLDVVNCITTRIDGGLIHTIQTEVSDLRGVHVPYLEQKLNKLSISKADIAISAFGMHVVVWGGNGYRYVTRLKWKRKLRMKNHARDFDVIDKDKGSKPSIYRFPHVQIIYRDGYPNPYCKVPG